MWLTSIGPCLNLGFYIENNQAMNPIITDPRLYNTLLKIDKELADEARGKGCPRCGGTLHSAKYPRKIKRSCFPIDGKNIIRFSFCCNTDGCRRRVTPRSVRFMGRRRYLSVVVVLHSALCHGLTQRRIEEVSKLVGVSLRTLSHWQTWWRETLPRTQFWQHAKAFLMSAWVPINLCRDLVEIFSAQNEQSGIVNLLQFISPMSCYGTSAVSTHINWWSTWTRRVWQMR